MNVYLIIAGQILTIILIIVLRLWIINQKKMNKKLPLGITILVILLSIIGYLVFAMVIFSMFCDSCGKDFNPNNKAVSSSSVSLNNSKSQTSSNFSSQNLSSSLSNSATLNTYVLPDPDNKNLQNILDQEVN